MDLEGLGIASTVTSLILILFAVIYPVFIKDIQDALIWPDSSVWSGWKEYFSLGVPTTGMLCAEYWAWESLAFIAGHLGVTAQANMMITIQVAASINTLSLGI